MMIASYPAEQREAVSAALELESEPLNVIAQTMSFREMLLRQRINEGARACMLSHSAGTDLDNLTGNMNTKRLTITQATDTTDAVMESDTSLRLRAQRAYDGLSVAGPSGAYEYFARSASGLVHRHKGTISALRRALEPLGYLIEVKEWWQLNEEPGTFRIVVGVLDQGITDEMYQELERLIADAKPVSRHLTGLAISLSVNGKIFVGTGCYHGDALTVYPYTPESIIVEGDYFPAPAIHLIDNLRVNA
nr:phage tail protein I [Escherichia coli]